MAASTHSDLVIIVGQGPVQDLETAHSLASEGYTVFVKPGIYYIGDSFTLFKPGVNWTFEEGAIVRKAQSGTGADGLIAIFDDRYYSTVGSGTCNVYGAGVFEIVSGEGKIVRLALDDSIMHFACYDASCLAGGDIFDHIDGQLSITVLNKAETTDGTVLESSVAADLSKKLVANITTAVCPETLLNLSNFDQWGDCRVFILQGEVTGSGTFTLMALGDRCLVEFSALIIKEGSATPIPTITGAGTFGVKTNYPVIKFQDIILETDQLVIGDATNAKVVLKGGTIKGLAAIDPLKISGAGFNLENVSILCHAGATYSITAAGGPWNVEAINFNTNKPLHANIVMANTMTQLGSSGASVPAAGSPEGAITGSPGQTYLNTTDDSFWVKKTGIGTTTGWIQLIAMLIMLLTLTLSSVNAQPVLKRYNTTNAVPTLGVNYVPCTNVLHINLAASNAPIWVVTNGANSHMEISVTNLALGRYFEFVVAGANAATNNTLTWAAQTGVIMQWVGQTTNSSVLSNGLTRVEGFVSQVTPVTNIVLHSN